MRKNLPLFIAVAACLPFLPALGAGFVNLDDKLLLLDNPHFRGLGWTQLRWMFTTTLGGPYQPLCWLAYALEYLLWGMNPAGYHAINLLFHAANAGLFFVVSRRLLAAARTDLEPRRLDLAAGAAALLFAVHPLRAESVAWISESRDVMSGFFYLLTILFYVDRRRAPAYAAFTLSLMCKGIGITLPAVLIVLDVYPLKRWPRDWRPWSSKPARDYWLNKALFAAVAGAFAVVGLLGQARDASLMGLGRLPLSARLAEAAYGAVFYAWKTLLPSGLIPAYRIPADISLTTMPFLLCALAVAAATAAAAIGARRRPALASAWFCYLLILAPVLGLVKFGSALVADRYSYLSCMGFALLAAGGLARLLDRSAARAGLALWLALMAAATWRQTTFWHDSESLWRRDAAVDPTSGVAREGLGFSLAEKGRLQEAIVEYKESLRFRPENPGTLNDLAEAWRELGVKSMATGSVPLAATCFASALALKPRDADAHANLAVALSALGRLPEAEAQYRGAIELQPRIPGYHSNLGALLARRRRFDEAIAQFQAALDLDPGSAAARSNLETARKLKRAGR